MDINQLVESLDQNPQFQPILQSVAAELSDASPAQVDELLKLVTLALRRPDRYEEIRAAAIRDDMVDPEDLPEQFDAQALLAVLVILRRLQKSLQSGEGAELAMRRGGLSRVRSLAARGRLGDTMLAHINPEEARMLQARGGAGTINPDTGLPQFFSLKKLFKAVLPIALNFLVPGLGAAIGTALGATGAMATALGGAVIGGLSSGLTGGNVLQGMLLGGVGGGFGDIVGGAANSALGLGLGQTAQSVLGGALVGGVGGAATGQGFGKGALMGAAGAGLGAATQNLMPGAIGAGLGAAGRSAGNMLTAGYSPKEALVGGALSGLATGIFAPPAGSGLQKPSDAVVEGLRAPSQPMPTVEGAPVDYSLLGGAASPPASVDYGLSNTMTAGEAAPTDISGPGIQAKAENFYNPTAQTAGMPKLDVKTLAQLAMAGSALSSAPPAAAQAVSGLSPQQQEYFNRPSIKWDWNKLQADANSRNMSLSQFMATYWPQVTSGAYNLPGPESVGQNAAPQPAMAFGGLNSVARLVRGGGTGRDDTISARLSDGEYVMDAETVAMLGDGSTKAGAQRLDQFREQLRRHKGKALVKGKFSPNAKSPLAYLKEA